MVLFVMLCKVVLTFESAWVKSLSVTIQMKATGQFFQLFSFVMPHNAVLVYDSVDNYIDCNSIHVTYYFWGKK